MAGTITGANLLLRIEDSLQDTTNVRWSEAELLRYINDAQREIVNLRPEASADHANVQLSTGTEQTIPDVGLRLIKVVRNMSAAGGSATGKRTIRIVDRDILDTLEPDWHDPAVTGDEIVPAGDATVVITGIAGTSALGTAVGKGGSTNIPTGLTATGSIGSVTIVAKCVLTLTGIAGTSAVGTVTLDCKAVVVPTGVQGTFTVGNETIIAVQFDYESIKENYSRARTVYLSSHSSNTNTSYVRAA